MEDGEEEKAFKGEESEARQVTDNLTINFSQPVKEPEEAKLIEEVINEKEAPTYPSLSSLIQEEEEDMDTPVKPNKKPSVQPNILMKKDEKSEKKSGVKIDETKNVIKKFARNERI